MTLSNEWENDLVVAAEKQLALSEKRKEWEKDLVVVAEKQLDEWTLLVILNCNEDVKNPYCCHRYFTIGGNWELSVDESYVDAETAMKWSFSVR